jgi:large subunit ribosomal protein L23
MTMEKDYDIIQEPLITEKGSLLSSKFRKYVFRVRPRANKKEIKEAVERIFNVRVQAVNTMNYFGKLKRVRYRPGYTADWKKAVVTLKTGHTIEFAK